MSILTVTDRGQITFRKEILKHLQIGPGDKVEVELLPNGRAALKAARPSGTWDALFGLLADRTDKVATLEEIDEAIAKGWAGQL